MYMTIVTFWESLHVFLSSVLYFTTLSQVK